MKEVNTISKYTSNPDRKKLGDLRIVSSNVSEVPRGGEIDLQKAKKSALKKQYIVYRHH